MVQCAALLGEYPRQCRGSGPGLPGRSIRRTSVLRTGARGRTDALSPPAHSRSDPLHSRSTWGATWGRHGDDRRVIGGPIRSQSRGDPEVIRRRSSNDPSAKPSTWPAGLPAGGVQECGNFFSAGREGRAKKTGNRDQIDRPFFRATKWVVRKDDFGDFGGRTRNGVLHTPVSLFAGPFEQSTTVWKHRLNKARTTDNSFAIPTVRGLFERGLANNGWVVDFLTCNCAHFWSGR